jgi:DNA/RNA-binding domain of Phe-tRNA-synthetase-like protein
MCDFVRVRRAMENIQKRLRATTGISRITEVGVDQTEAEVLTFPVPVTWAENMRDHTGRVLLS